MKISYERKDSVEIYDNDLKRIAVNMQRGSSFDTAFNDVICGYDDDIFYKRDFFKDEVEEIVKNIKPNNNQQVVITINNITPDEVSRIVNHKSLNFHLGVPENLPIQIDVNTIEEE